MKSSDSPRGRRDLSDKYFLRGMSAKISAHFVVIFQVKRHLDTEGDFTGLSNDFRFVDHGREALSLGSF